MSEQQEFYGIWSDNKKEWANAQGAIFCTVDINVAMAQLDLAIRNVGDKTLRIRAFSNWAEKEGRQSPFAIWK